MINAQKVLDEMNHWWHHPTPMDRVPRTPEKALNIGVTYLYNQTLPQFQQLKQDSARTAHFRQLFTVWKAVCSKLREQPFYDPSIEAVKVFLTQIERQQPEVYVQLLGQNAFLGVRFTDEERARHERLRKDFVRPKDMSSRFFRMQMQHGGKR